jgi:hypothetical protein
LYERGAEPLSLLFIIPLSESPRDRFWDIKASGTRLGAGYTIIVKLKPESDTEKVTIYYNFMRRGRFELPNPFRMRP